ncbi:hypothetical protein [Bradyrhizobium cenepequi]
MFAVLITVLVLELRPPERPTFEASSRSATTRLKGWTRRGNRQDA